MNRLEFVRCDDGLAKVKAVFSVLLLLGLVAAHGSLAGGGYAPVQAKSCCSPHSDGCAKMPKGESCASGHLCCINACVAAILENGLAQVFVPRPLNFDQADEVGLAMTYPPALPPPKARGVV